MGGLIETPGGIGRFVNFDGNTGKVTVEMDWHHEVEYPGTSVSRWCKNNLSWHGETWQG